MNKRELTEADIRTKYITPALGRPNGPAWNLMTQIREEVYFTKGRVIVRGKTVKRGDAKKVDYLLFYKPNLPIAVIEAKDNNHAVGDGMQQALEYAELLDVPFAYSSNGDAFLEHDRTRTDSVVERELTLEQFPSPEDLWARYSASRGYTPAQQAIAAQDYYDGSGKGPWYYQLTAINRTVDAIARGEDRILLVMATGTGKTYTAFQIIWRLWKSGAKKRILFLVDRNILADQTKTNDFKPFGQAMTKITNRTVDKAFEIYLSPLSGRDGDRRRPKHLQAVFPRFLRPRSSSTSATGAAPPMMPHGARSSNIFRPPRRSVSPPRRKKPQEVSNIEYFGDPIYTYSLKQGIADGFLAPYKVVRIGLDKDLDGWRPEDGQTDKYGQIIEDREYNDLDFDRNLILEKRTELVAAKITEFLKATDRFAKTIVFCENIDHAERMRQALVNANADLAAANSKYVMRITGDNDEGKAQLDNFIDPESTYPVIATTSRLMTTGVDAQTCQLIVLDRRIESMTEFKQIIGRGTRINEDYNKLFFTIMDFKRATALFADPDFDGDPVQIYEPGPGDPPTPPDDPQKAGEHERRRLSRSAPFDPGTDGRGRGQPNTTSMTSRSPLLPSGFSISTRTASSSPNRSGTTRGKPFARITPLSTHF